MPASDKITSDPRHAPICWRGGRIVICANFTPSPARKGEWEYHWRHLQINGRYPNRGFQGFFCTDRYVTHGSVYGLVLTPWNGVVWGHQHEVDGPWFPAELTRPNGDRLYVQTPEDLEAAARRFWRRLSRHFRVAHPYYPLDVDDDEDGEPLGTADVDEQEHRIKGFDAEQCRAALDNDKLHINVRLRELLATRLRQLGRRETG